MKERTLENVQRWMQAVITHPAGVEAGLAAPAAQSHLSVAADDLNNVIEPSPQQTSVERLEVYAGAYHARLIECLAAEFPVFRETVGEDAFTDFAVNYLQRHPSQSYTLGRLGAEFERYLTETKPSPAPSEAAIGWADFLIDVARLERTVSEVFDGPGLEKASPLLGDALLTIDAEDWPRSRLVIAPCLRLLPLRFPLNDYYTSVKRRIAISGDAGEEAGDCGKQADFSEIPHPQPKDAWLAITRRDYVVRRYELDHSQFALLDALKRGATLEHAIEQAAQAYSGDVEQLAADLHDWFRIWAVAPMFESATSE